LLQTYLPTHFFAISWMRDLLIALNHLFDHGGAEAVARAGISDRAGGMCAIGICW
jgi:hypothetical protein